MKAAEILELDEIWFLEPSYSELVDGRYSDQMVEMGGTQARLLLDEQEDPIALAVLQSQHWFACNFIHRMANLPLLELFEGIGGEIYQCSRGEWIEAVREHYSVQIMKQITPAMEDVGEGRLASIESLVEGCWGRGRGEEVIDACCGSGIGTLALRRLGYRTVSYDNDLSLLSLGLSRGRLLPERAICIDGARAVEYCERAPLGAIFMAGEVNRFTEPVWHAVIIELLSLVERMILTFGTEREADIAREWIGEVDRPVRILEHRADPFYDRWVCLVDG
ncbi:MAG: hypothetical protein QHG99_05475 [Methanomicrobiales archaeon]|nr:hypothetical protein [Methanomicrobiales archaeon]